MRIDVTLESAHFLALGGDTIYRGPRFIPRVRLHRQPRPMCQHDARVFAARRGNRILDTQERAGDEHGMTLRTSEDKSAVPVNFPNAVGPDSLALRVDAIQDDFLEDLGLARVDQAKAGPFTQDRFLPGPTQKQLHFDGRRVVQSNQRIGGLPCPAVGDKPVGAPGHNFAGRRALSHREGRRLERNEQRVPFGENPQRTALYVERRRHGGRQLAGLACLLCHGGRTTGEKQRNDR